MFVCLTVSTLHKSQSYGSVSSTRYRCLSYDSALRMAALPSTWHSVNLHVAWNRHCVNSSGLRCFRKRKPNPDAYFRPVEWIVYRYTRNLLCIGMRWMECSMGWPCRDDIFNNHSNNSNKSGNNNVNAAGPNAGAQVMQAFKAQFGSSWPLMLFENKCRRFLLDWISISISMPFEKCSGHLNAKHWFEAIYRKNTSFDVSHMKNRSQSARQRKKHVSKCGDGSSGTLMIFRLVGCSGNVPIRIGFDQIIQQSNISISIAIQFRTKSHFLQFDYSLLDGASWAIQRHKLSSRRFSDAIAMEKRTNNWKRVQLHRSCTFFTFPVAIFRWLIVIFLRMHSTNVIQPLAVLTRN